LSSWPRAAVEIKSAQGARVHHNVIQYNRRHEHNNTCGPHNYGLGYGVVIGPGRVMIEANVFDHNRHDIASDGSPGALYTATYNLVLDGAVEQSFDVHGGKDRHDCTNIAGTAFVIHHNTFLQSHKPAVRMRGIPVTGAWIYKNQTRDGDQGDAFNQINSSGNFTVEDNATNGNLFPAWSISFGGASFWQWQQFERTAMSKVAVGDFDFDGDGAADGMRVTPHRVAMVKERSRRLGFPQHSHGADITARFRPFREPHAYRRRSRDREWMASIERRHFALGSLYKTKAPLSSAVFGDFEGDDHIDAFFADGTQWSIAQSFSPRATRHYMQPYKLTELQFGNFVGDSKMDALRSTGSEWLVWDHVSKTWNHPQLSSIPLSQLTFADFDEDGFTDIARSVNGQWLVSWVVRARGRCSTRVIKI